MFKGNTIFDVYIFGASSNGKITNALCERYGISVKGFLDNDPGKTEFCGLPVYAPERAPRNCMVLITSPHYAYDIRMQLLQLGFENIESLSDFAMAQGLAPEAQWAGDMVKNASEYDWLRNSLADSKSRVVLDAMLKYRTTLDLFYPAAVCSPFEKQWFDDEFFKPGDHVFIDGGSFDGDTAEQFLRKNYIYGPSIVHLFDPSENMLNESRKKLGAVFGIHYHHCALSDKSGTGYLKNIDTPQCAVIESGDDPVECRALDDVIVEPVTFLKLDVEGFEEKVLRGARRHIIEDHPFMAIAVYHKPEDLWSIPRVIAEMAPNYKFYLRHYTQFYHETVLYCV